MLEIQFLKKNNLIPASENFFFFHFQTLLPLIALFFRLMEAYL